MALVTIGTPLTGTSTDDFIVDFNGDGNANTMYGGDGDDLIYGDSNGFFNPGYYGTALNTGTVLTAFPGAWSLDQNDDIANSTTVPHATLFEQATGGSLLWYQISVAAGQTLTLDIDYGFGTIGTSFDAVLELYSAAGTLLNSNDQNPIADGGFGSVSQNDSFLQYTFATAGVYSIAVGQWVNAAPPGPVSAGVTFVLNPVIDGL